MFGSSRDRFPTKKPCQSPRPLLPRAQVPEDLLRWPCVIVSPGFEHPESFAEKQRFSSDDDVKPNAISIGVIETPPESRCLLAPLAAAWNRLTDPDRAEVVELSKRLATHPSHPTSSDSN